MAQTVGMKLALEGEKTYSAELKKIQQQTKELAAEMKAVVTAGEGEEKMMSVLNKQIENSKKLIDTLNQKYEKQKKGIEETKQALADAEKEYGENSVEVQKLKTQLEKQETQLSKTKTAINNETAELNKLEKQESDTAEETKDLGDETQKAGDKAKKGGDGFTIFKGIVADLAASAIKSAISGLKELGSAVVGFAKEAVNGYAEAEQLRGGVEKLFGDDAQAVIKNSSNAFKTAGLSANQYMETVTGVSASLISSLGGDTAKAAEMADMMISDMSDNANVFGTAMEDVQAVYTSLSKGQFQTLDNLKLGFAGTKTGMQELMEEAEKLDSSFIAQRDDAGNLTMEYADMVQAIHIVQKNMKITGTTQKEAAKTIQGSISAMQGAWKNFVAGLGDDTADITKLANDVIESATNVATNVMPIISNIVKAVPTAISSIVKSIKGSNLVSTVLDSAREIISSLIVELPSILDTVFDALEGFLENFSITDMVTTLFDVLNRIIKSLVPRIPELLVQLIAGIIEALPSLFVGVGEAIYNIFNSLFGGYDKFDKFTEQVKDHGESWQSVVDGMSDAKDEINKDAGVWEDQWELLQSITDENGKVKEGYHELAQQLAGELNEALGLNIEFQKGQIKNYDEICNSIQKVMDKKRAEMILEAEEEAYAEALKQRPDLINDVADAEANYEEALRLVKAAQEEYDLMAAAGAENLAQYDNALTNAQVNVAEMSNALDEARANLESNTQLMAGYMDDYTLAMNGDYQQIGRDTRTYTGQTLEDLIAYRDNKKRTLDQDNANLESWKAIASETNSEYANEQVKYYQALKDNTESELDAINELVEQGGEDFSAGYVNGILDGQKQVENASKQVTDSAVKMMQNTQQSQSPSKVTKGFGGDFTQGYINGIKSLTNSLNSSVKSVTQGAVDSMRTGSNQSYNVGSNMVSGMINGVRNMASSLYSTMTNMAYNAWNSVKSVLGIHSPSKMFAELGKYSAEGFGIGYTDEMKAVTAEMASGFDGISSQVAVNTYDSGVNTLIGLLESYLPGLGQIDLYLDSGELVGGTAEKMDEALGAIRVRTARGM